MDPNPNPANLLRTLFVAKSWSWGKAAFLCLKMRLGKYFRTKKNKFWPVSDLDPNPGSDPDSNPGFEPRWHSQIPLINVTCFWTSRIRILQSEVRLRMRILLSSSKKNEKNFDFYCFVTSLWLFIFEKRYKCNKQENLEKIVLCWRLEGQWRK